MSILLKCNRFYRLFTFIVLSTCLLCEKLPAQQIFSGTKYPLADFRMPLDIKPPALAGSFGELRANHFHSGLDFKTNQRIGYPVYATADGYISRLRVQNSGFGLAIYLAHSNGFTSVYAHLSRFSPKISQEVLNRQYKNKSYELDEYPTPNLFLIRQGELIGYSGNTGSSGGPHLHFEVRDTKTQLTVNPQLLGIDIPDQIKPLISALYVYRLNGKPFNEYTPKQYFQVKGSNGNYQLNQVHTIRLGGEVGFGLVTTDRHSGPQSGLNGVYSIELFVDNNKVYTSALEKFSFENSKGINAHIDYPTKLKTGQSIQKSFVDDGNPLQIYYKVLNKGRIRFDDDAIHQIKYVVTDAKGNQSELQFKVQSDAKALIPTPDISADAVFTLDKTNEYQNEGVKVIIPKGSLYNELNFVYKSSPKPNTSAYSITHHIQNSLTPLHTGFELWIKPDSSLMALKDKALIVNSNGSSQGGFFENGYVKAQPKTFGNFYVTIDTVAPHIYPQNITEGKNMSNLSKISFKISDNLSGIKSFNGYIDGSWVLMAFDQKTANLWHEFDTRTKPGNHIFELIVEDMKGNIKKYKANFYR